MGAGKCEVAVLSDLFDDFDAANPRFARIGFGDAKTAHRNVAKIASGIPQRLGERIREELNECLPNCPDPDRALNNLERMIDNLADRERFLQSLIDRPSGHHSNEGFSRKPDQ